MVRLAYLLVGSLTVAEDLVQDAFVRVYFRWGQVDHHGGYLRTTVVNACRNHLRDTGRRRWLLQRLPDTDRHEPPPDEPTELMADLNRLSPRRRAALVLRYYADLDDAAIAKVLECREATVRSLVHRGLTQLREVMPDATR